MIKKRLRNKFFNQIQENRYSELAENRYFYARFKWNSQKAKLRGRFNANCNKGN